VLALDEPGRLRQSLPGAWFEVVAADAREAATRLEAQSHEGLRLFVFGDRLHAWLSDLAPAAARPALDAALTNADVTPTSVRPIVPSLEDVFIAAITGSQPS
jgi:hypothetical protein